MDGNNNDNREYCSIDTTHEIIEITDSSDSGELQFIERPSTKKPKKRKRTAEEIARRKPDVFHYDGATRRNMAPKIIYPQDRIILNRLLTRPWAREAKAAAANKPPTYPTAAYLDMEDEDGFSLQQPFWTFSPRVAPVETMPLKDRKRFFIYTPTSAMVEAMQATVSALHAFFNPIKNIGDCMLHPRPPPLHPDGSMRGTIQHDFRWEDDLGIHSLKVNYGVVTLLVNSRLTNKQKEGWIEEAWHLSHLCGNWICCNWRHHTIEDGPTNVSRNGCFASSKACTHKPPCMKDKKQKLVLPAHKGRQTQLVVVPEMMDDESDEVDEETPESGCAAHCGCRKGLKRKRVTGDDKGKKRQDQGKEDGDEDDEENTS